MMNGHPIFTQSLALVSENSFVQLLSARASAVDTLLFDPMSILLPTTTMFVNKFPARKERSYKSKSGIFLKSDLKQFEIRL